MRSLLLLVSALVFGLLMHAAIAANTPISELPSGGLVNPLDVFPDYNPDFPGENYGVTFGSAAAINTGTSGAVVPLLNGNWTASGNVNFSGATITFSGLSSGTVASNSYIGLNSSNGLVLGSGGSGGAVTLGTSGSANNPQRSGQAGTGLFSASSNTVSVAAAGSDALDIGTTGITAVGTATATALIPTGTTAPSTGGLYYPATLTPAVGANGYPAMYFGESGAAVNFLQAISEASGTYPVLKGRGNDTNVGIALQTQGSGNVTISAATAAATLDMSANTNSMLLPSGTSAQRPSGATGMIRYNSTTTGVEAYYNSVWNGLLSSVPATSTITLGTSASATNPQRSGEASTGIYSLNSGELDFESYNGGSPSLIMELTPSIISIGLGAGVTSHSANNSVFVGVAAGQNVNGGSNAQDVAIGQYAGDGGMGYYNTYVGYSAGHSTNGSGNVNTALGNNACGSVTGGGSNICIGASAGGSTLSSGSNNILIGSDVASGGDSNEIAIGGTGLGSHTTEIGLSGTTTSTTLYGSLTITGVGVVIGATNTPADNATCTAGTMWWDTGFIYVCTSSGTVKRAALSTY